MPAALTCYDVGTMRLLFVLAAGLAACAAEKPFCRGELIFPPERWHNHGSSIVELPGAGLFACWYHGSGERTADDVRIEAARRAPGHAWQPRFTLADTPGFPDCNPALFVDSKSRLWLLWPTIIANQWHTALMKYRITSRWRGTGAPPWDFADNLLFIPRNFAARVKEAAARNPWYASRAERASDKYFSRMGWMTRVHPIELPGGRILVPLYSDGFDFSLVAISDDGGLTWTSSEPLLGAGNVQPSIVRRRDGTLVAFMRDNGPPPKRILVSTSRDEGVTWSNAEDTTLPNPGAGIEAVALRDGLWALAYNDTERGRYSLALALSDDEGRTWKYQRRLEYDAAGKNSYHYPSIIQARDGRIHVSYSYSTPEGQSIKHAECNVEWIKEPVKQP